MHCPKCGSKEYVKSGIVREKQRFKCRCCGCHFTQSSPYRYDRETRKKALQMVREGVSLRAIERILGVSHVTVMRWVRRIGEKIQEVPRETPSEVRIMEMDEMWTFCQKNSALSGCGWRLTATPEPSLPGNLVAVQLEQPGNSGEK